MRLLGEVLRTRVLHDFLIRNGTSVRRDLLRANSSSGLVRVSGSRLLVAKLLPDRRSAGHPEADKELVLAFAVFPTCTSLIT
jgi:hypothetical protein